MKKHINSPSIKDAINSSYLDNRNYPNQQNKIVPVKKYIRNKNQYEHPKWQKKRLEIFRRDYWKCKCCDATDVFLHVHHLYYNKNCNIWDIDNEGLVTVCFECHQILHNELSKLSSIIAFEILAGNFDIIDFDKHLIQKYTK